MFILFFTLDSLLAHRILSFPCNFRISSFLYCVVKLMHVLSFLFLFQPGNLLLHILYFSLLPLFFFSFVSYFIILTLLSFITALYATNHDHGTWFVRVQLCYVE